MNHCIRMITPEGLVTTLVGEPEKQGYVDGAGWVAKFFKPHGVAVDANNNVIVADTFNHAIRKITPCGCGDASGGWGRGLLRRGRACARRV